MKDDDSKYVQPSMRDLTLDEDIQQYRKNHHGRTTYKPVNYHWENISLVAGLAADERIDKHLSNRTMPTIWHRYNYKIKKLKETIEKHDDTLVSLTNSTLEKNIELDQEFTDWKLDFDNKKDKFNIQNEELSKMLLSEKDKIEKQQLEFEKLIDTQKNRIEEQNLQSNKIIKQLKQQIKNHGKVLEEKESHFKITLDSKKDELFLYSEEVNKTLDSYKTDIEKKSEQVENAFLAKLKTEKLVTFWDDKKTLHETNEKILLALLFVFFVSFTLSLLYLVYTLYQKDMDFKNIKLWATVSMGGLSFIAVWVGRFLVKLYLLQHTLKEEASEKLVISKSYTSLIKDELITENQSNIILQALFGKAIKSDFSSDSTSVMPQETLLETLKNHRS